MVKGVPTDVSEKDFKELLDLSEIIYSKAERLTSKETGSVPQMFELEIKDEAEVEAHISQNLQGERISVPSFITAVLELPNFRPLSKNM